ncbi:MAG TPA: T9SS type A sorting domain-containing protein, partial [Ignavibacteria bacterium]|nr:T9SS type A sorting domain-containing protein [Ignavibacteria bacterium]
FTVNKNNSDVKLQIYDINGKLISTLINKIYQSGSYETKFNGNYLPTGVYFYKLSINNISQTKRMILMK